MKDKSRLDVFADGPKRGDRLEIIVDEILCLNGGLNCTLLYFGENETFEGKLLAD